MQEQHDNFYVITGGPGSGKTTLLEALQQRNYAVVPEVARQIIIEQSATGGKALPWGDRRSYLEMMLERSVASYEEHRKQTGILFFDRSILDAIGYAKIISTAFPPVFMQAARQYRYNKKVFILPPWKEIYTTDTERKQTWEEAVATYEILADTYTRHDYQLIDIPPLPVEMRVRFVEEFIHPLNKKS